MLVAALGRTELPPRALIKLCLKLALPNFYVPTDMVTGSRLT
ncbi:hypothetical protein OEM_01740 [Mycobacterium intracellulare subsp. yongonense 05-1390]|nr:hypothetical protein OEM_01740 [Mycobacterium intracellulare subsp. yongonense 05-1390]ETZ35888.1 hypothetical protein L842_0103 [Mycobacterium intracellulare MIN_052511_1280]